MKRVIIFRRIIFMIAFVFGTFALIYGYVLASQMPFYPEGARTHHVVLISVDALASNDLDTVKDLPNFRELMQKSAISKSMEGIYPSVLASSHVSMVTGKQPFRHGVYNDKQLDLATRVYTLFDVSQTIKEKTLWDLASKFNMKVATLNWPVSSKTKVPYNYPQIKPLATQLEEFKDVLGRGNSKFILDMNFKFGKMIEKIIQPNLDDFYVSALVDLIKSKQPPLVLIHLNDLGYTRRIQGVSSSESMEALKRIDARIGKITKALKDNQIDKESTVLVAGCSILQNAAKTIKLNKLFAEKGLLSLDSSGKITDWKAIANSAEGAAFIYLKSPENEAMQRSVSEAVFELIDGKSESCVQNILTGREVEMLKIGGDPYMLLEAKEGYQFSDSTVGAIVSDVDVNTLVTQNESRAATGYNPQKKGMTGIFIAAGQGISAGVEIDSMKIIDIGPTIASLLGFELPEPDGISRDEIFTEEASEEVADE